MLLQELDKLIILPSHLNYSSPEEWQTMDSVLGPISGHNFINGWISLLKAVY